MEKFVDWVRLKGCTFDGLQVRSCGDDAGYGIFAKRSFRINEALITVPLQLMITAGMVAELPRYKLILERCRLQPFELLVVFFLTEEQDLSSWTPYLDVLPKTFSTPVFTESSIDPEHLPISIRGLWLNQQSELSDMFKKINGVLDEAVSWHRFLWAWHVVNTRCIFVENKEHPLVDCSQGDTIAVIPFVDMINHSNDYQGWAQWDNVNKCYKVIATRMVFEGDQVFVCYGGHSNARLWMEYGFVLPDNIYNKLHIAHDLLFALAKSIGMDFTEAHAETVRKADLPCTLYATDMVPSFGFKANLRILQLHYDQLSQWSTIVYEADESNCSELIVAILNKVHEMVLRKMDSVPNKLCWLWREQLLLIEQCVSTVQQS